MAWTAKRCVPVVSSWVFQLIQGCGGEFAIQFKMGAEWYHGKRHGGVPGITCYYPKAPASYFDLALVYPSKGRFVHDLLYRKQPYQVIKSPCPAGSCICSDCDAAPTQWKFAFSGITGGGPVDCSVFNQTMVISHIDNCKWEAVFPGGGGLLGTTADLFKHTDTIWWLTFTGAPMRYKLDTTITAFDCMGDNVMSKDLPDFNCVGFPATVTVSPA